MSDVFISYASEDRRRAALLAQSLEAQGLSVWWDRALAAGDDFEAIIDRELSKARQVVVLWSAAAAASPWVRSEAAAGLEHRKLIPARLDKTRPPRPFDQLFTQEIATQSQRDGFVSLVVSRLQSPSITFYRPPRRATRTWWPIAVGAGLLAGLGVAVTLIRSTPLTKTATGFAAAEAVSSRSIPEQLLSGLDRSTLGVLLDNLRTSGTLGDRAIHSLIVTGDLSDAIARLEDQYSIQRAELSDAEKISFLKELAALAFYFDSAKARVYYENILDLDSLDFVANARLGQIAYWQGDTAASLDYFDRARQIGAPNAEESTSLDIRIGTALLAEHDIDAAIESLEAGAGSARENGLRKYESEAQTRIANALYLDGRYQASRELYRSIMDWQAAEGFVTDLANGHCNLGRMAMADQDFPEALSRFQDCLQLEETAKRSLGIAFALQNLGTAHTELGNFPQADEAFATCLTLARQDSLLTPEVTCSAGLARLKAREGLVDEACAITARLEASYDPDAPASTYSEAVRDALAETGCGFAPLGLMAQIDGDPD